MVAELPKEDKGMAGGMPGGGGMGGMGGVAAIPQTAAAHYVQAPCDFVTADENQFHMKSVEITG